MTHFNCNNADDNTVTYGRWVRDLAVLSSACSHYCFHGNRRLARRAKCAGTDVDDCMLGLSRAAYEFAKNEQRKLAAQAAGKSD